MAADLSGRLDHILPQGYLRGFTHPGYDGQLSVFDRGRGLWFESGTSRVAAIKGYYDYPPGSAPDQSADQAFKLLEDQFPVVREELVSSNFSSWQRHLDFLLRFAQMLRSRSQLYREQEIVTSRTLGFLKVEEVLEQTADGKSRFRVAPFVPNGATEFETLLRSKAITDMRAEIAKGAAWMSELNWCLRWTEDENEPVIVADNAIVVTGSVAPQEEGVPPWRAFQDQGTLVFFPLCRRACLIGCPARFERDTDIFHQTDLRRLRSLYFTIASRFVYSPMRVDNAEVSI